MCEDVIGLVSKSSSVQRCVRGVTCIGLCAFFRRSVLIHRRKIRGGSGDGESSSTLSANGVVARYRDWSAAIGHCFTIVVAALYVNSSTLPNSLSVQLSTTSTSLSALNSAPLLPVSVRSRKGNKKVEVDRRLLSKPRLSVGEDRGTASALYRR